MRIPYLLTHTPKIKKNWHDDTDPQAERVYLMERSIIGWNVQTQHSLEYLESVVRNACRTWKVPEVKLRVSSSPRLLYGECDDESIWLNSNPDTIGNNLGVLVHELAHWITDKVYGDELPGHGPEFVTVYGQLLNDYNMFPSDCWKILCDRHGVEYL